MILYCDGSTFHNGKPGQDSRFCVITDDDVLLAYQDIGDVSINVAEYAAVIFALRWAEGNRVSATVQTDSTLVVAHQGLFKKQKAWKCEQRLQPLRDEITYLLSSTGCTLIWRPREENKAGHYIEEQLKIRRKNARAKKRSVADAS